MIALIWIEFMACAGAIALAGPVLTRNAQRIADALGLSASWVGLVLLATATSLPELFTGLSASSVADAPNIAVGDALGSCVFNLLLLALLDLLSRDQPLFGVADRIHIMSAALGLVLIGTVGMVLVVAGNGLDFEIGPVSIYSPLLILLYGFAMRAMFSHERRSVRAAAAPPARTALPWGAITRYGLAGLVVLAAGAMLPFIGIELADAMGWRKSFVGTMFVAAATSLPELVVMIAALRMRSIDMAIANLLGSNLFDVLVLAIDDFAYRKGSLLAQASPAHAGSALAAMIMSGIVIIGLVDQPRARLFGMMGWISILLVAIYALSTYSIFLLGH
jgi:cation:H+ antiporter